MEKFLYSGARHGARASFNGADLLRFLESRLQGYRALSESLTQCRAAFVTNSLDGIMTGVEIQSSLCEDIQRSERAIQSFCEHHATDNRTLADVLTGSELTHAEELMRRTKQAVSQVFQQNRVYANMVRKAAYNNAILRNLYQVGSVYSDPRLNHPPGGLCGTSEAQHG